MFEKLQKWKRNDRHDKNFNKHHVTTSTLTVAYCGWIGSQDWLDDVNPDCRSDVHCIGVWPTARLTTTLCCCKTPFILCSQHISTENTDLEYSTNETEPKYTGLRRYVVALKKSSHSNISQVCECRSTNSTGVITTHRWLVLKRTRVCECRSTNSTQVITTYQCWLVNTTVDQMSIVQANLISVQWNSRSR